MSNGTSDGSLLSTFSISQASVLGGIGAVLSGLASIDADPFTSGLLTVLSVMAKLGAVLSPDPAESEIADLRQTMHDYFVELGAVDAALEILNRKTTFSDIVSNISAALNDIPNSQQQPSVYPAGALILACQAQLNRFTNQDDEIWNITYSLADFEKLYWTDWGQNQSVCYYLLAGDGFVAESDNAGYGPKAPPLNGDGTVFEYRITLPMYLWAISAFLAVGRALDPNFLTNNHADIIKARDTLQWVYQKIMQNGLTPLLPPDWTSSSLQQTACPPPTDGAPPPRPALRLAYSAGPAPPSISGVAIEYGAVEKFSGSSSIGNSYQVAFTTGAEQQNHAILNKLQIRVLKRVKDLYRNDGFLMVWQAIDQLSALVGDPPLSSNTFTWVDGSPINLNDWSFRQLITLANSPKSASGYSLRALGDFLIATQPFDTPYVPGSTSFSFQQLLTAFSD